MKINLSNHNLNNSEKDKIVQLLKKVQTDNRSDLEKMWYLMDYVWDEIGCDNRKLDWDKIGKFYSHPVWILNGLFIEQDSESMKNRENIKDWIISNINGNIIDYGGGFGTLARLIAESEKNLKVSIYEPHPSEFSLKKATKYNNIKFITKLENSYDCLVSTDVLEHVADPLAEYSKMIKSVKLNGHLIIANAFHPCIKCHLPQSFHFIHTFTFFSKMMGLELVTKINNGHTLIFKKKYNKNFNFPLLRIFERISKIIYPIINILKIILRPIKNLFR